MGLKIKTPQTKNDWWNIVDIHWRQIEEFCHQTLEANRDLPRDLDEMRRNRDSVLTIYLSHANSQTWVNHQEAYALPGSHIVRFLVLTRSCLSD